MEAGPDRLLTLTPWVLERLLQREYEVTFDNDGNPRRLEIDPDHGMLSTDTIEEDLKACVPKALREPLDKLFALRLHRTPERVSEALEELGLHPKWLPREKLLHADWPTIVGSVYWGFRRFSNDVDRAVIASRIGLGPPGAAYVETELQWSSPKALPEATADYVVRDMIESFPRVVERLNNFQVTAVTSAVPSAVAQYAREASRCYLHGFFAASVILCRSCIEAGVSDRLDQEGFRQERVRLPHGNMEKLLNLALTKGVLDDVTFPMADEIRESTNKTVHQAVAPSEADCREMPEKTRAVLRHLYE